MDITKILLLVLGAVLAWLTVVLIAKYREAKTSPYGEYFKFIVGAICDAAEIAFDGPGRGKEKFEWVMNLLAEECATQGIIFDAVAVSQLVEKYVDEIINAGRDKTAKG